MPAKTLVLIDGHYHIYRSFFAFGTRPLTNSEGQRVETAYTIASLLWNLYRAHRDDYLWAIALDTSAPTFRHDAYPDYKANREAMPEELRQQLPWVEQLIAGFRIPVLRKDGFEADDLIATAATKADQAGHDVIIYSKDKDLEQVLSDRVKMLRDPKTGELFGPAELLAKKFIRPDQVTNYQALVGDSSDNIPGVKGVGPKTAVKVLDALGAEVNLGVLLEDPVPESVPPAALKKIRAHAKEMVLSRQLVELLRDADVPSVDETHYGMIEPDVELLRPVCMKLGFQKMLRELEKPSSTLGVTAAPNASPQPTQGDLFAGEASAEVPQESHSSGVAEVECHYELVNREESLLRVLGLCRDAGRIAVDTETTGRDPLIHRAVGFSLAWRPGEAAYIPLETPSGENFLPRARVLELTRPLLEDPDILKVGHNLKFDFQVFQGEAIRISGIATDTMVAAYLLNPNGGSYKLDTLIAERFHHGMTPIEDLIGPDTKSPRVGSTGKVDSEAGTQEFKGSTTGEVEPASGERTMADLEPEAIRDYACEDADFALRLADLLDQDIERDALRRVHDAIETPLIPVLADMEREGITLQVDHLRELESEIASAAERVEQEVYLAAGGPFNIASPKQLQAILFEQLKLDPVRKTKTGQSTSADVLEELTTRYPEQPLPALVLEHRTLSKLLSTYVRALPKLVNPQTGRIHTDLRQTVAATGRLASNKPNLQNIPNRTELGRRVRRAFVANHRDYVLLSADYSQIELRILAHFCQDPALERALRTGADIHTEVAATIAGVPAADVTRSQRSAAKAVTFGVIYGMGAFGLARDLGIPRAEAQNFIDAFFASFPGVREFTLKTIENAKQTLEVRTLYGRRRPLPELNSRLVRDRRQGERFAVNTVIQGSAADLIKKAMIDVQANLAGRGSPTRMLLQIHDELLFEVPRSQLVAETEEIRQTMEGVLDLTVPLTVNVASGEDWYEASK